MAGFDAAGTAAAPVVVATTVVLESCKLLTRDPPSDEVVEDAFPRRT